MANVKSIGGNPIVLGLDGLTDDAKQALDSSVVAGAAESLLGVDETSQWAQRTTEGSGAATVRSVQGAAVGWNQLCNAITRSASYRGIDYTCTDGKITLSGTSTGLANFTINQNVKFNVTAGHKYIVRGGDRAKGVYIASTSIFSGAMYPDTIYTATSDTTQGAMNINVDSGVTVSHDAYPALFDLTQMFGSGNEPTTVAEFEAMYPEPYYPYSAPTLKPVQIAGIASTTAQGGELDAIEWTAQTLRAAGSVADMLYADHVDVNVGERAYQSGDESDATVRTDGTTTYYPLATPTTTPISPALPMSYRVQQGGTESIIVPDGEVSAAPILTVAEGESAAELVMDALACIATPDGPVATANHAVNTYLTMGGKLYKVTSAIAVGETITAGTNVTETTVMAELIARTA